MGFFASWAELSALGGRGRLRVGERDSESDCESDSESDSESEYSQTVSETRWIEKEINKIKVIDTGNLKQIEVYFLQGVPKKIFFDGLLVYY